MKNNASTWKSMNGTMLSGFGQEIEEGTYEVRDPTETECELMPQRVLDMDGRPHPVMDGVVSRIMMTEDKHGGRFYVQVWV